KPICQHGIRCPDRNTVVLGGTLTRVWIQQMMKIGQLACLRGSKKCATKTRRGSQSRVGFTQFERQYMLIGAIRTTWIGHCGRPSTAIRATSIGAYFTYINQNILKPVLSQQMSNTVSDVSLGNSI